MRIQWMGSVASGIFQFKTDMRQHVSRRNIDNRIGPGILIISNDVKFTLFTNLGQAGVMIAGIVNHTGTHDKPIRVNTLCNIFTVCQ